MKISMKVLEKLAIDYANVSFSKAGQWSEHIIAKSAFLSGFEAAINLLSKHVGPDAAMSLSIFSQDVVDVDFPQGSHQLK